MATLARIPESARERVLGLARQLAQAERAEKPNKDDKQAVEDYKNELGTMLGEITGLPESESLRVDVNTGDVFRAEVIKKKRKAKK